MGTLELLGFLIFLIYSFEMIVQTNADRSYIYIITDIFS